MKSDQIVVGSSINQSIWARGIEKVPRKIRVHADKDEKGVVRAEMMGIEIKIPKPKEEKKEEKKEEPKPEEKKAAAPIRPSELRKTTERSRRAETRAGNLAKRERKEVDATG